MCLDLPFIICFALCVSELSAIGMVSYGSKRKPINLNISKSPIALYYLVRLVFYFCFSFPYTYLSIPCILHNAFRILTANSTMTPPIPHNQVWAFLSSLCLPFIIYSISFVNSSSATTTSKTASKTMTNAEISMIVPTKGRDRLTNSFLIYVVTTSCVNG